MDNSHVFIDAVRCCGELPRAVRDLASAAIGELLIDSPVGLIGSIICPYIVMVIGTEGHVVCDASEQRPNQLIEIWLVLSSYLLLMAGALYLGILPASPGLFVMPLVSIVFILLFVLWQRRRIHRRNDKPVIRD